MSEERADAAPMAAPGYGFVRRIGRVLNSGQSRALVLTGNVHDLFFFSGAEAKERGRSEGYVPLLPFLLSTWDSTPASRQFIKVVYELNGPVTFMTEEDKDHVRDAWTRFHKGRLTRELAIERLARLGTGYPDPEDAGPSFEAMLENTSRNPTMALEFLRQLCLASRATNGAQRGLQRHLVLLVEGADLLIPEGEIARLSETDRGRIAICRDWFGDSGFMNGNDSVLLITESRSLLNGEVTRLPHLLSVEVPSPDLEQRLHFISWFVAQQPEGRKARLWSSPEDLARLTAGLSIHALMQLLKDSAHTGETLRPSDVVKKVEEFIQSQLGEDVVEFKRPEHRLKDLVGNRRLKEFVRKRFIPRVERSGKGSVSGAIVAGPNRSGKSYIFEAVAAELGMVVLVLKNLRSKWYGETDVIFERLRRLLEALGKALIFVDEADSQFGQLGPDAHETERRLTGKIQNMMADPRLRGKVMWLLLTARVQFLSPDIRQPGRAGDYIIPVLDPDGEDLEEFVRWMLGPARKEPREDFVRSIGEMTRGYSAGEFASRRDELAYETDVATGPLTDDQIIAILADRVQADVAIDRRIQALHALLNCTHRSLLPDVEDLEVAREEWRTELARLDRRLR